jgi:hypothetical protein
MTFCIYGALYERGGDEGETEKALLHVINSEM